MPTKKTERVNLSLSPEIYKKLEESAEKQDIQITDMIRQIIRIYYSALERSNVQKSKK